MWSELHLMKAQQEASERLGWGLFNFYVVVEQKTRCLSTRYITDNPITMAAVAAIGIFIYRRRRRRNTPQRAMFGKRRAPQLSPAEQLIWRLRLVSAKLNHTSETAADRMSASLSSPSHTHAVRTRR